MSIYIKSNNGSVIFIVFIHRMLNGSYRRADAFVFLALCQLKSDHISRGHYSNLIPYKISSNHNLLPFNAKKIHCSNYFYYSPTAFISLASTLLIKFHTANPDYHTFEYFTNSTTFFFILTESRFCSFRN